MDKLLKPGRIIFSIGMIALGVLCILSRDFIIGRPPAWPSGFTLNTQLSYVAGSAVIIAGIAVAFNIYGAKASVFIALLILLLSVSRHLVHFADTWLNAFKAIALAGGCLIVAAASDKKYGRILPGAFMLALFLVAGGYAHFKYADFVNGFIPAYIPFHPFFTYFCGVCLFAGGIGILIPATRSLAALLSGIMIGGWFILLHIPRFLANTNDASDRMGLCESFTFCGIFFVLAAITQNKKTR